MRNVQVGLRTRNSTFCYLQVLSTVTCVIVTLVMVVIGRLLVVVELSSISAGRAVAFVVLVEGGGGTVVVVVVVVTGVAMEKLINSQTFEDLPSLTRIGVH